MGMWVTYRTGRRHLGAMTKGNGHLDSSTYGLWAVGFHTIWVMSMWDPWRRVMGIWIQLCKCNLLTSWGTARFSRRTLLHEFGSWGGFTIWTMRFTCLLTFQRCKWIFIIYISIDLSPSSFSNIQSQNYPLNTIFSHNGQCRLRTCPTVFKW